MATWLRSWYTVYAVAASPAVGCRSPVGVSVRVAAVRETTTVPNLRPLNHATLSEQVYQYLRQQILDDVYPPLTALPEATLAIELAVSRVPVREALRRLAAEGLVTLRPRQGAV